MRCVLEFQFGRLVSISKLLENKTVQYFGAHYQSSILIRGEIKPRRNRREIRREISKKLKECVFTLQSTLESFTKYW